MIDMSIPRIVFLRHRDLPKSATRTSHHELSITQNTITVPSFPLQNKFSTRKLKGKSHAKFYLIYRTRIGSDPGVES